MDLSEFLLAHFAEDEEVAREALDVGHYWLVEDNTISLHPDDNDADGFMAFPRKAHAHHAAYWSPTRVLAECAKNRRILSEHMPERPDLQEYEPQACRICYYDDAATELHPCPTLRALALPYAGHPDFDPAWRLDA